MLSADNKKSYNMPMSILNKVSLHKNYLDADNYIKRNLIQINIIVNKNLSIDNMIDKLNFFFYINPCDKIHIFTIIYYLYR